MRAVSHCPTMQRGVTLLENMVALLILSVGLLGMAGLQVYTLRGESSTTYRLLAIQQAQDMADRIRSNIAAVYNNPNGPQYLNVAPDSSPPAANPDCNVTTCTPTQLAAFDIIDWQTRNNTLLPGDHDVVGGYITGAPLLDKSGNPILLYGVPGSPPRMRYTITMIWDGERTGSTNTNCNDDPDPNNPSNNPLSCITLVVDL